VALQLGFGFQNLEPGQKPSQAIILAWLGLAQFGLALAGSQPEAGPSKTLKYCVVFPKYTELFIIYLVF